MILLQAWKYFFSFLLNNFYSIVKNTNILQNYRHRILASKNHAKRRTPIHIPPVQPEGKQILRSTFPLSHQSRCDGKPIVGISGGVLDRVATRRKSNAVLRRLVGQTLSFLAAREIAFLAWHDFAGVIDVEENESDQHGERVKTVLICFLVGDAAIEAV